MDAKAMARRLAEAPVGRFATVGVGNRPHVVPITFARDGDTLYFAVDAKPKRTVELQRLKNIAANPSVCVLVDDYEEDWKRLWWVRVDGSARIVDDDEQARRAIDLLVSKYPQYAAARPRGPVVAIAIERISGWSHDAHRSSSSG